MIELWGSGDVCRHFGISSSTLQAWRRDPHFPEPLRWNRNTGGLWYASDVRAWKLDCDRPRNARRGAVIGRRRQGQSIRGIAIELGCSRSWVRDVLRQFGEYSGAS